MAEGFSPKGSTFSVTQKPVSSGAPAPKALRGSEMPVPLHTTAGVPGERSSLKSVTFGGL
jgi:hypothetical protein